MLLRLVTLAALAIVAVYTMVGVNHVAAEGEATGLAVESQTCTPGFTVQVVLSWTPSGAGTQWVDLSLQNDGFTTPYTHGGPLNASRSEATVNNLEPQRNYYVRVSTWNGTSWERSDLFAFTTGCQPHEATGPRHVAGASISDTAARFNWEPGNGNLWYCLDYAATPGDLLSQTGTWRNTACGTTATTHVVTDMHCGRDYFARVWAWTTQGGRHSAQVKVSTQPCATTITRPIELRALFVAPHLARLAWEPGRDNIWYCVDVAANLTDLLSFSETWENHCGLTEPELELRGLDCETTYVWRVYTWNYSVNVHSQPDAFATPDCDLDEKLARVDKIDVHKSDDGSYRAEVTVFLPNGCHRPGTYDIDRDGNQIEITVRNLVESPLTVCSLSSGPHLWTIQLHGDFAEGVTYEVEVNNQLSAFFTPN